MVKEKEIKKAVEDSITNIISNFKEMPYSYYNERDIHSSLFAFLERCSVLSTDYKIKDSKDGVKYYDILLHSETKTISGGPKRKKSKKRHPNNKKIFDIVTFDPRKFKEEEIPLVAIEIKHNYFYPNSKQIKEDINKLIKPKNKVKFGYLLILNNGMEKRLSNKSIKNFEDYLFSKIKKKMNLVIYYLNMNYKNPKEYQKLKFSVKEGILQKTKPYTKWKKTNF